MTDGGWALRRVERVPDATADGEAWPDSVPAVGHLLRHGLDLPAGVTFLVGENGTGKSTIVEATAELLEIPPDGGSSDHVAGAGRGRVSDRADLAGRLRAVHGSTRPKAGFFLRAETMHRFVSYLEDAGQLGDAPPPPHPLHQVSHGESFVEMLTGTWVRRAQIILLDEPESALSFTNQLALTGILADVAADGKQVVCATHSPVLTALPGAHILQLDDDGITPVAWEDLEIVEHWRSFLTGPDRYLRHLLG